ncbi:MAG: hypothetical protein KF746_00360 [Chitinophagaceae bacterium]|nr:hypothetical protein [Chitinophagaceae bacterium]
MLSYIENTNDEALLSLLKEDLVFYGKAKGVDILDHLNEQQLKELTALSEEEALKDTHALDEFQKATQQ